MKGNIEYLLGNSLTTLTEIESPEVQLRTAMQIEDIIPPEELIFDGEIHRFATSEKAGDQAGWYIIFGDGIPAGSFGDWRTGKTAKWRAETGESLSPAEESSLRLKQKMAMQKYQQEQKTRQSVATTTANAIWNQARPAPPDHPYLVKKGIQPHLAKVTGGDNCLILPLYDGEGNLSSLQYITPEGNKRFHTGGATSGRFTILGEVTPASTIYIAEGFATASTIHEATEKPVVITYSANNIEPVVGVVKNLHPLSRLVIVADHDASGVGQEKAQKASESYHTDLIIPPTIGDINDFALSGGDVLSVLQPKRQQWLVHAEDFCKQPTPIRWLIKRWVQDEALIMVHGPSGSGKTFIVLDWCLRISSGLDEWIGFPVKNGEVVYLAGEGHHGLKARISAWKHYHQVDEIQMVLSKEGTNLNTPEGTNLVVDSIKEAKVQPRLIVIDTLHRFLLGDENTAKDTKSMLDACAKLMQVFSCSVLLIHHTGVNPEAQHRGRGSSAWRGALDNEISIEPANQERPTKIVQRKVKDAEITKPIWIDLQQVVIPDWFDEDGEQATSAVVVEVSEPQVRQSKTQTNDENNLKDAWKFSGCDIREEMPYLSKADWIHYLVEKEGKTKDSARQAVKTTDNRMADRLVKAGIIQVYEEGFLVIDASVASSLLLTIEEE